MASSRSLSADLSAAVVAAVEGNGPWLVGLSGGLDSSVLLHVASHALGAHRVIAVHIHHGLQPVADQWPAHCKAQAEALDVRFECVRLQGAPQRGESLEAWARQHRYAALCERARTLGAHAILTAHHADDQLETMLMRLARGTGLHGLTAMNVASSHAGVPLLRPFLSLSRDHLHRYGLAHDLDWVEDPSNADLARTRNTIRHRVLPRLEREYPGISDRLLSGLPALRELRDRQVAQALTDLASARLASGLDRAVLGALSADRVTLVIREWLRELGLRMPSRARVAQMLEQLVLGQGPHGRVLHEGVMLLRDRDWIRALRQDSPCFNALRPLDLLWQGQARITPGSAAGSLVFRPLAPGSPGGISRRWLAETGLQLVPGGRTNIRLRVRASGPSRTLKNLYQECGIPGWQRPSLPLLFVGQRLLFAAGLGMDCSADWPRDGDCVQIGWEPVGPEAAPWPPRSGVSLASLPASP